MESRPELFPTFNKSETEGARRFELLAECTRGELQINDVLVEAGPRLSGALLTAGLVDEWILYLAPKLLGPQAKPLAAFARLTKMSAAPRFELLDSTTVGPDVRLRLRPKG